MVENATLAALEAHKDAIEQARRNVAHGWRGSDSQWSLSLALVAIDVAVRADIEAVYGVCLACAEDIHSRCSGSAGVPCRCLHPLHAGTSYGAAAREIWHRAMRVLARGDLDLDRFYDEAFPNDPYLSGVMRAEVDRMRGDVFVQHDLGDGLACRHCGASGLALNRSCEGPPEPSPFDGMTTCGECGQAVGTEVHSHD